MLTFEKTNRIRAKNQNQMSTTNNTTPVKVESIEMLEATRNITEVASLLKMLGIIPGKKTQKMISVHMPMAKKIIFYLVLAAMLVIGFYSVLGSYYMTQTGFIASLILSTASIGILFLCFYHLKGQIKYWIIAIDLIAAIVQVTFFVPSGLNRGGLAAQQKQMIQAELTYADSIMTTINTYIQMGKTIHSTAIDVSEREKSTPGQIYASAVRIVSETEFLLNLKEGKLNLTDVINESISSSNGANKVRQMLRDSIKKVSQPLLSASTKLKTYAAGWQPPLKAVVTQLEGLHSNEVGVLTQLNDARMLLTADTTLLSVTFPVYNYVYKGEAKPEEEYTLIASVMEGVAILFLLVLIFLMYLEESTIDIPEAIKESRKTIMTTRLLVDWNIQPGDQLLASEFAEPALTKVLLWLEEHMSIVKDMQQRRFTLEQFIQLYKEQSEELLLAVYHQVASYTPHFHIDEIVQLPLLGDKNVAIVNTMSLSQWKLLKKLVNKPEEAIDYAVMITKTWPDYPRESLIITDESDELFEFVDQNEDVAKEIKRHKIGLPDFAMLYSMYEQDELVQAAKQDSNFNLNHLRNNSMSSRQRISADVLKKITAKNKAIVERYSIPVDKFILLDTPIMECVCDQIVALEAKMNNGPKLKDYIAQVTKDLTVLTLPMVKAWKAMTDKPFEADVVCEMTTDVLKNITIEVVDDLFVVMNEFENSAAIIIMKHWKILYSNIVVKWQADQQLYSNVALIEILKKAAELGNDGLTTLFASYQTAEAEKELLEEQDRKALKDMQSENQQIDNGPKVKEKTVITSTPNSPLLPRKGVKVEEIQPVPVVPEVVVPVVVPQLPIRKIVLGIKIPQLTAATTPQEIINVLSEAFTVK